MKSHPLETYYWLHLTTVQMGSQSFDFIIVGGGTAGIALATRLSEVADQRILVLEAGIDHSNDPRVDIPAFYTGLFGTAQSLIGGSRLQPRKSSMGGS